MSETGGEDRERGLDWTGLPAPELVRAGIGLLLGALTATIGALLLGEYQFEGWLPVGAGLLFGLVVGEVVVEVGRRRTLPVAILTGALAAGGLVWAGWIESGRGLEPIAGGAKLAAAIAFLAAAARTADPARLRRRRAPSEPG